MLKMLWLLLIGRFCAHAWVLVTDRDFPAKLEVYRKEGGTSTYGGEWVERMCIRTYFAIVKCDKCGALKTFRTRQ